MDWRLSLLTVVALVTVATPGASAPTDCADPCDIASHAVGYVLPVTAIASGTRVTWSSLDSVHINADVHGLDGSGSCFFVAYSGFDGSPAVRFDVTGGALTATTDGNTETCTTATALASGGFVVPYYCVLHSQMHGAIVVSPA